MVQMMNWDAVFNLANSIIGVGILALPFSMKSLGFLLGPIVLALSGYLSITTSLLLVEAAYQTKSRSYEQLSMKLYGKKGKRWCELNICAMLIGVLVSFHSVIGDSSLMIAQLLGIQPSGQWRIAVQLFFMILVELPFSLLRNISSLNVLSVVSLIVYSSFTLFIFIYGTGEWLLRTEPSDVPLFKWSGLSKCYPILALAFSCQTTLLPIYAELPNSSIKKMTRVINYALLFVGFLYLVVGLSGSLAFGTATEGNVLNNFPLSPLTLLFKVLFLLCLALSFPLVVFPTRISINSLIMGEKADPTHMTNNVFQSITVTLVIGTLFLSILFPKVDSILALSGATSGCFISMIFPGLLYLRVSEVGDAGRTMAKICLWVGVFTTVFGVLDVFRTVPVQVVDSVPVRAPEVALMKDIPALSNSEILEKLDTLQHELDDTRAELRAEKALRIENQIRDLKSQLKELKQESENPKFSTKTKGVNLDEQVEPKKESENKVAGDVEVKLGAGDPPENKLIVQDPAVVEKKAVKIQDEEKGKKAPLGAAALPAANVNKQQDVPKVVAVKEQQPPAPAQEESDKIAKPEKVEETVEKAKKIDLEVNVADESIGEENAGKVIADKAAQIPDVAAADIAKVTNSQTKNSKKEELEEKRKLLEKLEKEKESLIAKNPDKNDEIKVPVNQVEI